MDGRGSGLHHHANGGLNDESEVNHHFGRIVGVSGRICSQQQQIVCNRHEGSDMGGGGCGVRDDSVVPSGTGGGSIRRTQLRGHRRCVSTSAVDLVVHERSYRSQGGSGGGSIRRQLPPQGPLSPAPHVIQRYQSPPPSSSSSGEGEERSSLSQQQENKQQQLSTSRQNFHHQGHQYQQSPLQSQQQYFSSQLASPCSGGRVTEERGKLGESAVPFSSSRANFGRSTETGGAGIVGGLVRGGAAGAGGQNPSRGGGVTPVGGGGDTNVRGQQKRVSRVGGSRIRHARAATWDGQNLRVMDLINTRGIDSGDRDSPRESPRDSPRDSPRVSPRSSPPRDWYRGREVTFPGSAVGVVGGRYGGGGGVTGLGGAADLQPAEIGGGSGGGEGGIIAALLPPTSTPRGGGGHYRRPSWGLDRPPESQREKRDGRSNEWRARQDDELSVSSDKSDDKSQTRSGVAGASGVEVGERDLAATTGRTLQQQEGAGGMIAENGKQQHAVTSLPVVISQRHDSAAFRGGQRAGGRDVGEDGVVETPAPRSREGQGGAVGKYQAPRGRDSDSLSWRSTKGRYGEGERGGGSASGGEERDDPCSGGGGGGGGGGGMKIQELWRTGSGKMQTGLVKSRGSTRDDEIEGCADGSGDGVGRARGPMVADQGAEEGLETGRGRDRELDITLQRPVSGRRGAGGGGAIGISAPSGITRANGSGRSRSRSESFDWGGSRRRSDMSNNWRSDAADDYGFGEPPEEPWDAKERKRAREEREDRRERDVAELGGGERDERRGVDWRDKELALPPYRAPSIVGGESERRSGGGSIRRREPLGSTSSSAVSRPSRLMFGSRAVPSLVQDLEDKLWKCLLDCQVCSEPMARSAPIWYCTSCYGVFHLDCIRKWATGTIALFPPLPSLVAGGLSPTDGGCTWHCPGCKAVQTTSPAELTYKCFCGKKEEPTNNPFMLPHSCAETCRHPLDRSHGVGVGGGIPSSTGGVSEGGGYRCPHFCTLRCHPGPHSTCSAMAPTVFCYCRKSEITRKCVELEKHGRSCGATCLRQMSCARHLCPRVCHEGPCGVCEVTIKARCFCGKKEELRTCGRLDVKGDVSNPAGGGVFACAAKCGKLLSCGNHRCERPCHSGPCGDCRLLPSVFARCPCGKSLIRHLLGGKERKSCLESVPTCDGECGKKLACGTHLCEQVCHTGPCPPCEVLVEQKCRCGSSARQVPCFQVNPTTAGTDGSAAAGNLKERSSGGWFACNRKCGRLKNCGRHTCAAVCCSCMTDFVEVGADDGVDSAAPDNPHRCMLVCGRKLGCGRHSCQELCHEGSCPPCTDFQSMDKGLSCACGRAFISPPVPCGTPQPSCPFPCSKPQSCGHATTHLCHFGPCPPCTEPVEKNCEGGHVVLRGVPCGSWDIRCNAVCGKMRACGRPCTRTCHRPPCDPESEGVAGEERENAVRDRDRGGGGGVVGINSYNDDAAEQSCVLGMVRRDPHWVAEVEARLRYLLTLESRWKDVCSAGGGVQGESGGLQVHVFAYLEKERRDVIKAIAREWDMEALSVGWEPKRFVVVFATGRSQAPLRLPLSAALAFSSSANAAIEPVFDKDLDMDPERVVTLFDLPADMDAAAELAKFDEECELVFLSERNAIAVFGQSAETAAAVLRRVDGASPYSGAVAPVATSAAAAAAASSSSYLAATTSSSGTAWGGSGRALWGRGTQTVENRRNAAEKRSCANNSNNCRAGVEWLGNDVKSGLVAAADEMMMNVRGVGRNCPAPWDDVLASSSASLTWMDATGRWRLPEWNKAPSSSIDREIFAGKEEDQGRPLRAEERSPSQGGVANTLECSRQNQAAAAASDAIGGIGTKRDSIGKGGGSSNTAGCGSSRDGSPRSNSSVIVRNDDVAEDGRWETLAGMTLGEDSSKEEDEDCWEDAVGEEFMM